MLTARSACFLGLWLLASAGRESTGASLRKARVPPAPAASVEAIPAAPSRIAEAPVRSGALMAPGKLFRHARRTLDLRDLESDGELLFDFVDPRDGSHHRARYRAGYFWKLDRWEEGRWIGSDPERIDIAELGGRLELWCAALGGSVGYVHGDAFVTYTERTLVSAGDRFFADAVEGRVALHGWFGCLDAGIAAEAAERGEVFLPVPSGPQDPHLYSMDERSLALWLEDERGGQPRLVGLAPGEIPSSGPFAWGLASGPLLPAGSRIGSLREVWEQPLYYTYETGPNPWNRQPLAEQAATD